MMRASGTCVTKLMVRFRMNLRLWSEKQPIADLLVEFGEPPVHLHRKGEAIWLASGKQHVPTRHYAAFREIETDDPDAVVAWIDDQLDRMDRRMLTGELAKMGVLEAVLWIAVFADTPTAPPAPRPSTLERLRTSAVRVLIENYAPPAESPDAEVPSKTWYPDPVATSPHTS